MSIRNVKKKYKFLLIAVVALVGIIAVSKTTLGVSLLRVVGLRNIEAIVTKSTCIGKNKKYMTWGFAANPVCVTTYADEGNPCKSSDECQSRLCVKTQNIREPYCRGLSRDYPLCSNGEATVENLAKHQERPIRIDFLFCD